MNFGAVINGNVFSLDATTETALTFVHSPIVSAEIERVFSRMSFLLSPQRLSMTFKHLRMQLILGWNSEY